MDTKYFISVWKMPEGDYQVYRDDSMEQFLSNADMKRRSGLETVAMFQTDDLNVYSRIDEHIRSRNSKDLLTRQELDSILEEGSE